MSEISNGDYTYGITAEETAKALIQHHAAYINEVASGDAGPSRQNIEELIHILLTEGIFDTIKMAHSLAGGEKQGLIDFHRGYMAAIEDLGVISE